MLNHFPLFDSHFHIIDPNFPLVPNNGFVPDAFTVENYLKRMHAYDLVGGTVVSGSFQAFDQGYLLAALDALGDGFVGVSQVPESITDEELSVLNAAGVRALRFNLKRGGSETLEYLEVLSNKLYEEYGWHTELYVDSKDLAELKPKLKKLKKFSIDHLGLTDIGLKDLLYWVEKGVKVKATGFGRITFDPIPTMKKIYNINPDALMFGTDMPSTRAKTPFSVLDIQLIQDSFSEEAQDKIFKTNALNWYNNIS